MTHMNGKTFQALVQSFFEQHLAVERNAGANTVAAYRDAIKLFLNFSSYSLGCAPDQLDHRALDAENVRSFLNWLQKERGCGARTRNHRLAALKALARFIARTAPEHLERCRLIREIPQATVEHPQIQYLTEEEVLKLISSIDASSPKGRRDQAIFLLLYNTGARVQELVNLNIGDVVSSPIPFVHLYGKGRKQRSCPLWTRTIAAIKQMLADRRSRENSQPLFLNRQGRRLSRSGVAYLLRKLQEIGNLRPDHASHLTPHVMRHTTAMHLLQSGVDITTIAAWLGHAQLSTTHEYVEITMRMKQAAIANESALPDIYEQQYPSPNVIVWLETLLSRSSYVQFEASRSPPNGLGDRFCT